MSFKIIGDSCCDYPAEGSDYPWLERVALSIDIGEDTYIDDKNLDFLELIKIMAESPHAPKSACPAPGAYYDAYDVDADDVYVVTLSQVLSGSYASAVTAANMMKELNPKKNIHVFDSKTAACGQNAICEKIYEFASSGMAFDEVVSAVNEYIDGMNTYFVLENLEVFRKSGRLNHLQSIITIALKLKLVMGGEEGAIVMRGKALSMDRALVKMADMIAAKCKHIDVTKRRLYITQCNCMERAKKTRDIIMSKVPFKDSEIFSAGGISTIYANSGGIVVCF